MEEADGSHTISWNASLPTMTASDDFIVEFSSNIRDFYQDNHEDDLPVVGADKFLNNVTIVGDTTPLDYLGTDLDRAFELDTPDASSADQGSAVVELNKSISQPTAPGVALDCDLATYTTDLPPTPDESDWGSRPGDRVCYLVEVDFISNLDFRNPVVSDFVPPNTTFETFWGLNPGTGETVANEAVIADVYDFEQGPGNAPDGSTTAISWALGIDVGGDLYVDETADHFEVIFSVIINGDPRAVTTVDIFDNLAKLTIQNNENSGGVTFSARDQAGFPHVEPHIVLDKRSGAGDVADDIEDNIEVVIEGDVVPYEVEITNDFEAPTDPADNVYARALAIDGWDVLPVGFACADVTSAPVLDVSGTVTCLDPLDSGYPLGGSALDGRSVLVFSVDQLDPQDSAFLTYSMTVPAGVAAGATFTNDAGVLTYDGTSGNSGAAAPSYYPVANIDTTLAGLENTDAANASSTIATPSPSLTKYQQSELTDGGAGTNIQNAGLLTTQDEATIGEEIDYRVVATLPEGANLYNARLTDNLNSRIDFVTQLTTSTFDDGDDGVTNITLIDADDGYFDVDLIAGQSAGDLIVSITGAHTVTVDFPPTWSNPIGTGANTLTLDFTTMANGNADIGENINNRANLNWNDSVGGAAVPTERSNQARTKVVEPNPQVLKTDDGTDTDVPLDGDSNVQPGDSVT